MGFLRDAWVDKRSLAAVTTDLFTLQGELAKTIRERNTALARVHLMETRMDEKLRHEDQDCLLCYLRGDK